MFRFTFVGWNRGCHVLSCLLFISSLIDLWNELNSFERELYILVDIADDDVGSIDIFIRALMFMS